MFFVAMIVEGVIASSVDDKWTRRIVGARTIFAGVLQSDIAQQTILALSNCCVWIVAIAVGRVMNAASQHLPNAILSNTTSKRTVARTLRVSRSRFRGQMKALNPQVLRNTNFQLA
jgi:hypothetical protein